MTLKYDFYLIQINIKHHSLKVFSVVINKMIKKKKKTCIKEHI